MTRDREGQWYVVLTHAYMAPELIGPFVDEGLAWDHVEHITLMPGWSASVIEPTPIEGAEDEPPTPVEASDPRPDGLLDTDRANFHTLMEACANDDVVILHAREKASGHHHALLSIASAVPGSDETDLIPVARMLDRSATEDYDDPTED